VGRRDGISSDCDPAPHLQYLDRALPLCYTRITMPTTQQEAFCHQYLLTGSPARAYYHAYSASRPFEGNSAHFRSLARQQILPSTTVVAYIVGLARMLRENFLVAANDLIARAFSAYTVAERNGDAKAMIAAVATIGRLTGVEFEAKARADDRVGERIRGYLATIDLTKSAAQLADEAGPLAVALLTGIVDGSIPADVNQRRAAATDLLNRSMGLPGAESVQAQAAARELQKRLDRLLKSPSKPPLAQEALT